MPNNNTKNGSFFPMSHSHQMAITFLCGGVSMVTAALSKPIFCMVLGVSGSRGCCWEATAGGGCRRTTI